MTVAQPNNLLTISTTATLYAASDVLNSAMRLQGRVQRLDAWPPLPQSLSTRPRVGRRQGNTGIQFAALVEHLLQLGRMHYMHDNAKGSSPTLDKALTV